MGRAVNAIDRLGPFFSNLAQVVALALFIGFAVVVTAVVLSPADKATSQLVPLRLRVPSPMGVFKWTRPMPEEPPLSTQTLLF